jgi:BASS family bile acid:Na+ symporter
MAVHHILPGAPHTVGRVPRLSDLLHRYFVLLLVGSYLIAGLFPSLGLKIRDLSLGQPQFTQSKVSLPMAMLALLLFNAGLGVEFAQLRRLKHYIATAGLGVVANLVVPFVFIFVVAQLLRVWHNQDEVQSILVGLALVASMPIAGSSTAWSQNANGNLALSLGLVLLSTALSPVSAPLGMHVVGLMTSGDYSEDLHELAQSGTELFLLLVVVLPSMLGILLNALSGAARIAAAKPYLKLANLSVLLILNYSNASVSLPEAIHYPDADFLALAFTVTLTLCLIALTSGWLVARLLDVDSPAQASMIFGLGMNNNGTGLVLASMALADHPQVMLPIIFYNLIQHLVAGCVDHVLNRRSRSLSVKER